MSSKDSKRTIDFVDRYLRETAEMATASSRDDLARIIELLFEAYLRGGTIYTCGNGGSAANASHLAADLAKFTWVKGKRRFKVISLCDNAALISALTNDEGFASVFVEQLRDRVGPEDVLVCLSVHGGAGEERAGPWSQNLLAAATYAKDIGARVIAFVGYDGGSLAEIADASVIVPPPVSGATSTPYVEGFHEVYHHLICERLLQLTREDR